MDVIGTRIIDFAPPVVGIDGDFNTFRLGKAPFERFAVGHDVLLVDSKAKIVIGTAIVTGLYRGRLAEMVIKHGAQNHSVRDSDAPNKDQMLFGILQRFYGPHIATPSRWATVIQLRST